MTPSAQYDAHSADWIESRLAAMPAAAADCVHLWQLDCGSVAASDESCFALLSPGERSRATGFLLDHDRRLYTIGRATLRLLLGAYLERAPRAVTIGRGAFGKPHVAPCENASGLEFNMAHSGGRIVYAVTRTRAVGVDLERLRPIADPSSVARVMLTRDEWGAWSGLDDRQRVAALFLAWVRKEAVLKGLGCGLAVRPSRLEVSPARGASPISIIPAECGAHHAWLLGDVHQRRGWATALALEGPSAAAVIHARVDSSITEGESAQPSRSLTGRASA